MRIISRHRDYYDSVLVHGSDPALTYLRETKSVPADNVPGTKALFDGAPGHCSAGPDGSLTVLPGWLLFCGSVHPFLRIEATRVRRPDVLVHAYSQAEFEAAALPLLPSCVRANYDAKIRPRRNWSAPRRLRREEVRDFFAARTLTREQADRVHALLGSPVVRIAEERVGRFLQHDRKAVADPVLADMQFFRVKDPFTAFQEISMHLGGVLGAHGPAMARVSDAVRAHKHGMDATSFRAVSPGPRKARRRDRVRSAECR